MSSTDSVADQIRAAREREEANRRANEQQKQKLGDGTISGKKPGF